AQTAASTGGQVYPEDVAQAVAQDVRHRLADPPAGDPGDDVVEAFQVLDVNGGVDVDAGIEHFDHVLPAAFVAAAGHVAVRQLVDQRHGRVARPQRGEGGFVPEGARV